MSHEEMLLYFSGLIRSQIGIEYHKDNYFQLESRLHDVVKALNLSSIGDLYKTAQTGFAKNEQQVFLDAITNNETSFFRDSKVFTELTPLIVERALKSPQTEFRIWSAACSSGQEAISLAISLNEEITNKPDLQHLKFSIFCTDICQRVLSKAELGEYSQLEVQRGMPAKYLVKYFKKDVNDRWHVNPILQKHMRYKKHNLREQLLAEAPFDLILCRNVLIYQNVEGKKLVLENLYQVLKGEGYLLMGSGESLLGLNNNFDLLQKEGTLIYKKKIGHKIVAA